MNKIVVNGNGRVYELNLPTKLEEITPEYLNAVTANINVAPNYALIGLVYTDTLTYLVNTNKKKQNATIRCIPVFVKKGECEVAFTDTLNTGDKLVISSSDMAMGHHVVSPANKITVNNVVSLIASDANVIKNLWNDKNNYYFVEFKVVPISAIHGVFKDVELSGADTFITTVETTNSGE